MLGDKKLEHFKKKLLEMKNDVEKQLDKDKQEGPNESARELADYDNHPADMGTEQFEQERDAGLKQVKEDRLQDINDALERIEKGTYGKSVVSGKPIPEERLEVEPTAKILVEEA
ncbi:TraR/DksA C4-type zinc finger protein [Virgibacillus necropolis]|uniref:Uncharacterized protein n=1 Tax=Virgibacillus necropolis TaxID=163877 RepID=A0A221MB62_9BACI|nr:hypothetical protein [Virgibacillus necropolis]ASN04906.1 hypothetical protein CFK40_07705 [Virgibacillus necropolis]